VILPATRYKIAKTIAKFLRVLEVKLGNEGVNAVVDGRHFFEGFEGLKTLDFLLIPFGGAKAPFYFCFFKQIVAIMNSF